MKRYNSEKDNEDTKETEKAIIAAMQYALMKLKEEEGRLQRKLAECIHKEEEEEQEALQQIWLEQKCKEKRKKKMKREEH